MNFTTPRKRIRFPRILSALTVALLGIGFAACDDDDPLEEAGENLEEVGEDIEDGVEDVGDEVEDATDGR